MTAARVITGRSESVLPTLARGSADAMVTDPPAGIAFLGKEWDRFRRARNPADVGRDTVHGRMSRNAPASGAEGKRGPFLAALTPIFVECVRVLVPGAFAIVWALPRTSHWTATALEDAGFEIRDVAVHLQGQGFPKSRSLLKPAAEHWILARTPGPLRELDIDGCRVGGGDARAIHTNPGIVGGRFGANAYASGSHATRTTTEGRWPANATLECCSETPCAPGCPVRLLDAQSGPTGRAGGARVRRGARGGAMGFEGRGSAHVVTLAERERAGASRFYFCAKAKGRERAGNPHPTAKPVELMRWLVRLVTPSGGHVLDPFAGSGTTGIAALAEGCTFTGIEREASYAAKARERISAALGPLFAKAVHQ